MFKILFAFIFLTGFSYAQDDVVFFYGEHEFEASTTQYLFGDKVKLRSKPSIDIGSDVLETLAIGSPVLIIESSEETMTYNGIEWNWYKVNHAGQIGYVLGGLIALTHSKIDNQHYLVSVKDNDEGKRSIQYRMKGKSEDYLSGETDLPTDAFSLKTYNNRGVEGIQNILFIDYFAEACGIDGGGSYIFFDGHQLINAIDVSRVADGGQFWFSEKLTFPDDDNGQEGVIIYEREHGYSIDEDLAWTKAEVNSLFLTWKNGSIHPDISKLDFEQDQE